MVIKYVNAKMIGVEGTLFQALKGRNIAAHPVGKALVNEIAGDVKGRSKREQPRFSSRLPITFCRILSHSVRVFGFARLPATAENPRVVAKDAAPRDGAAPRDSAAHWLRHSPG